MSGKPIVIQIIATPGGTKYLYSDGSIAQLCARGKWEWVTPAPPPRPQN